MLPSIVFWGPASAGSTVNQHFDLKCRFIYVWTFQKTLPNSCTSIYLCFFFEGRKSQFPLVTVWHEWNSITLQSWQKRKEMSMTASVFCYCTDLSCCSSECYLLWLWLEHSTTSKINKNKHFSLLFYCGNKLEKCWYTNISFWKLNSYFPNTFSYEILQSIYDHSKCLKHYKEIYE